MAACTRAGRPSGSNSTAGSERSSTVRSPRPKSWWPATGCGRSGRWTRLSNGSSARPSMRGPTRFGRSTTWRACDGAFAIDPHTEAHRAIEAIWRIESARLIAGLSRMVGDIGTAEELAQDALVAALEQWPTEGVPEKPGAWLMGTAKHRALDLIRRRQTLERKQEEIGREIELARQGSDADLATELGVGDDLLGLMFMACHPVLSKDARVALTLRVLGGLTTEEIARAFLVPAPTIAQRIVPAKRTLTEKRVRVVVPGGAERATRRASVLEASCLLF